MKLRTSAGVVGLTALASLGLAAPSAFAGAQHSEWDIVVTDYMDCTGEWVTWNGTVRETTLSKVTPSGQAMSMTHWNFTAEVTSDSGYVWTTKGIVQLNDTYSLDNSLTGKSGWIENAILKSQTPGVPDVRLDVRMHMVYNAAGELVVDRFEYFYHCIGRR